MLNVKGYLGPIGDDIPSLIPLVVGLVIFFTAFTHTLNEFNLKTRDFEADKDVLIIANTLKGDSYISDYAEFDTACKGLRVRGLNYTAGIVLASQWNALAASLGSDALDLSQVPLLYYPQTIPPTTLSVPVFSCNAGIDNSSPEDTKNELEEVLRVREYSVMALPIAVEETKAVVPATLVVIAWRA